MSDEKSNQRRPRMRDIVWRHF